MTQCSLLLIVCLTGLEAFPAERVELLEDIHFARGFNIRGTEVEDRAKRNQIVGKLVPGWNDREPAWLLSQWYSRQSIAGAEADRSQPDKVKWENRYKTIVIVNPDSPKAGICLGLDAYEEFKGVYRDGKKKDWPHLLISQRISGKNGHLGESAPSIGVMSSLEFQLSYRVLSDDPHKNEKWHRNRHAARLRINLTIQNLRADRNKDKEYGQFIWFVITLYDDRHTQLLAVKPKTDKASNMLIYNVGLEPFAEKTPEIGKWNHLEADILPYIHEALQYAWENGILAKTRNLQDYKIGSMNFGYEVTGLNTIFSQVRDLGLQAVIRE